MKLLIALCLVVLCAWAVFAQETATSVITVDANSFDQFIQTEGLVLLNFAANFCVHCKRFFPELSAAAVELGSKAIVGQIDCALDKNISLCQTYKIEGFPTLLLLNNNGDVVDEFTGDRTSQDIITFYLTATQPHVFDINDETEYNMFIRTGVHDNYMKVLYIEAIPDEITGSIFSQMAMFFRGRSAFARYKTTLHGDKNQLIIYRDFDEKTVIYDGDLHNDQSIKDFYIYNNLPRFGEMTPDNFKYYLDLSLPLTWVFYDFEQTPHITPIMEHIAKKYFKKIAFVRLDGKQWGQHSTAFGLSEGVLPGIVIEDRFIRRNFIFPQDGTEYTEEALDKFVSDYLSGTLEPLHRSQPIPENNHGPIIQVVGTTFNDIIINSDDKDVFVFFYADWCRYSQGFQSTWEEFAQEYINDSNIVIAKFEATLNDFPSDLPVEGFPTLYLFRAGKKNMPVIFEEERTLDNLKQFIKDNRTTTAIGDTSKPTPSSTKPLSDDKDEL